MSHLPQSRSLLTLVNRHRSRDGNGAVRNDARLSLDRTNAQEPPSRGPHSTAHQHVLLLKGVLAAAGQGDVHGGTDEDRQGALPCLSRRSKLTTIGICAEVGVRTVGSDGSEPFERIGALSFSL